MHSSIHDDSLTANPPAEELRAYFSKRASDHRTLAFKAVEPGIRSIHLRLQALYGVRAEHPDMIHPD